MNGAVNRLALHLRNGRDDQAGRATDDLLGVVRDLHDAHDIPVVADVVNTAEDPTQLRLLCLPQVRSVSS